MSILRGAMGLLAAGTAVAAYRVAKEAKHSDPGIALGAIVLSAFSASAAAHNLADEVEEFRNRRRRLLR